MSIDVRSDGLFKGITLQPAVRWAAAWKDVLDAWLREGYDGADELGEPVRLARWSLLKTWAPPAFAPDLNKLTLSNDSTTMEPRLGIDVDLHAGTLEETYVFAVRIYESGSEGGDFTLVTTPGLNNPGSIVLDSSYVQEGFWYKAAFAFVNENGTGPFTDPDQDDPVQVFTIA
jgi:hypothetical protein